VRGPGAPERLRHLLRILPWLAQRGGASYQEIAERFGGTAEGVRRDLEVLSMCGTPPYTPDVLIDVFLDDDWVTVNPKEQVARPLQLTAMEGFRVQAAGRALLEVDGADRHPALASALEKLGKVLGDRVEIDVEHDERLDELREAAELGHTLEIEYYTLHRDEVTTRLIDPRWVHNADGRWYVEAFDHQSGEPRRFRVSRIQRISPTEERFEPARGEAPPDVFTPGADVERATVRLPPSARWVAETYPVEDVAELGDGAIEVTLAVAGRPWLERLLLRAGPEAEVVAPEEWGRVGADAAERVLARYPD
jgi:proteasome accessory factor C